MALRFTGLAKPLLQVKTIQPVVRQRSNFTPMAGWFEPKSLLFHPENIIKHAEVIPIGIITLFGFACEVMYTVRNAFTRDDVRFLNKKMACEQVETRVGPMYPAPIRKCAVYNQKYQVPPGLLKAMQTQAEEEPSK